jgi:Fe-S cluster biosynthesis and repair protein YggX
MNNHEKIRQNLANLSKRARYENTLRAFLSEDDISLTMELGDQRPSEVKYRIDDLISKKGWQNRITVLEHRDSVILINQRKGRYMRLISDATRQSKGAILLPTDSRRGAYLPSLNSR